MENRMSHLLRLELKKFDLKKNILITLLLILFSILFLTVSLVDSMTDPEQTRDTFESTFLVIGILMSALFLIDSSILTVSLVIREYTHRTIIILFCCPLNKRKLIAAKLILITAFTTASMLAGYLCCCAWIIGADAAFDMLEGSFHAADLSQLDPCRCGQHRILCRPFPVAFLCRYPEKIRLCCHRHLPCGSVYPAAGDHEDARQP